MTTTSALSTSFTSLVSIDANPWSRLDDRHALARFHTKFWGTAIAEEDEVLHVQQQSTSDPSESENDDREFDDFDIKTGYVLDIGILAPNTGLKRIWAEYIRIYNYLVDFYQEKMRSEGLAPAAVLTGQPGIGKSVWVFYALRRCLAEKRPVIWRFKGSPYLFVEDGVYLMGTNFRAAAYNSVVWTLVDSDQSDSGVLTDFAEPGVEFFIIYVTSPANHRWSRLHKSFRVMVSVMNPWTRNEIHQAAALNPSSPNSSVVNNIYDKFGPIARLCLEMATDAASMESYEAAVDSALTQLPSLQNLEKLTVDAQNLKMDALSHKLCLIRRKHRDDVRSLHLVMPITDHIRSKLSLSVRNCDIHRLIEVFKSSFALTSSRGMSGYIFENICHQGFQKQILIQYMPMIRLVRDDRRCRPKWHSSHEAIHQYNTESQELEKLRQDAFNHRKTLHVRPIDTCEYNNLDFAPKPNVYYIPKKANEVAFDSFIRCGDHLYIFQFTVSSKHDIKDKLTQRFAKCPDLPPQASWRFIFIIPDGVKEIESPYSQSHEAQIFTPFSSQVAMDSFANPGVSLKQQQSIEGKEREEFLPKEIKSVTEAPTEGSMVGGGDESSEPPRKKQRGQPGVKAITKGKKRQK